MTTTAEPTGNVASAPSRKVVMNRAIREALDWELSNDPKTFLMGEDIGKFGGVYGTATGFIEKFGETRVRDTPISEAGFMAAAAGAAMTGMKPIVELMFIDFMGVCLDPIYNFISKHAVHTGGKQDMPVLIMAGIGGGIAMPRSIPRRCLQRSPICPA